MATRKLTRDSFEAKEHNMNAYLGGESVSLFVQMFHHINHGFQSVLEMGRSMPVCHTGTSVCSLMIYQDSSIKKKAK
jgi:hypothetical protein